MDLSKIISQSFQITLKNRALWVFGIIAAFFGSGPQFFNLPFVSNFNLTGTEATTESSQTPNFGFLNYIELETLLLLLILVLLILFAIVLVVVYFQIWSYGALVSQTLKVVSGKPASYNEGKKSGEKFFWRVLGFRIVIVLILVPAILVLAIPPLLFFVAGMKALALAFLVIDIIIFILGIFVYAVTAGIVSEFGLRLMIEKDLDIKESLLQGLHLFRNNLGHSLLVWLVNMALGFVLVFPFIIVTFIFFGIGFVLYTLNPWLVVVPITIFFPILAAFSGIWNVFIFSYWSLAYIELMRGGGQNAASSGTNKPTSSSSG